jgi:putative glutamine amidotransferase
MTHTHPRIGFSLDYETKPTFSKKPWYAIRENYLTAVADLGALPLPLPHLVEKADTYLDLLDGLVITGGAFDIPPSMYGDDSIHETVTTKDQRTQFEWAITKGAIQRNIPILGICGGEQLLAVVLGGTLIQHIPDSIPNALAHEQPNPRDEVGHSVKIVENTLLHQIIGATEIQVNSAHHQAVAKIPAGAIVNATAPDGVIEGIEVTTHPFCLGVQWHPEYHVTGADRKIFEAFVGACAQVAKR